MLILLLILMFVPSVVAEESKPKHRSLHLAPMAVGQSLNVALENEDRAAMFAFLQADPRWKQTRKTINAKGIAARNELAREAIETYVPKRKRQAANRAIVQFFFTQLRPDLAFDWLKKPLSDEERKALQSIRLPKDFLRQLEHDRVTVITHTLQPHFRANLGERIGEPFYFGNQRLNKDLEISGDLEGLQMLMSSKVQEELKLTDKQVKQAVEAIKSFRKEGLLPCDDLDILDNTPEELEAMREEGLKKANAIINDAQRTRFDQLLCQRYLLFDETLAPLYLQRHLGERYTDTWSAKIANLPVEVKAVAQLRYS